MVCKDLCCNWNNQNKLDEKLKKWVPSTYIFSKHHINKFILMQQGVYPYDYMQDWKKVEWNTITTDRRFLQTHKHGTHYWFHALKKYL